MPFVRRVWYGSYFLRSENQLSYVTMKSHYGKRHLLIILAETNPRGIVLHNCMSNESAGYALVVNFSYEKSHHNECFLQGVGMCLLTP